MERLDLVKTAVKALDEKKAQDIQVIEITDLTILADYFILATGSSSTQVKALADEVEHKLSLAGREPSHIEGKSTGWILLDYGSVVIHVFYGEQREFYQLEKLWQEGKALDISTLLGE
ncbi:MAG: ribosome silencing factor [Clostridiales bacterium]|nr:ribosome silencing factor [Clostridiales bacterium]